MRNGRREPPDCARRKGDGTMRLGGSRKKKIAGDKRNTIDGGVNLTVASETALMATPCAASVTGERDARALPI